MYFTIVPVYLAQSLTDLINSNEFTVRLWDNFTAKGYEFNTIMNWTMTLSFVPELQTM